VRPPRLHYCGRVNEAGHLWPQALAMYLRSDEFLAKAQAALTAAGPTPTAAVRVIPVPVYMYLRTGLMGRTGAGVLGGPGAGGPHGAAQPRATSDRAR
jgi:hypothetical protein